MGEHGQATLNGGVPELLIEGREHGIGIQTFLEDRRARELYGVIASEAQVSGEIVGSDNQRLGDLNPD